MTKNYALFLLNQLCVGASVDAKPIIPQFELAQALSVAIKALEQEDVLDKIRAEIEQLTSRYSISKERGGMGIVEWSDRLIEESDVLQVIDKYKAESEGEE